VTSPRIDLDRVVEDTVSLVRIDSQSPGAGEAGVVDWLVPRLRSSGISFTRQAVAAGRENVVAGVAGGRNDRPRLVLLAHMDTVPVGEAWTTDPLSGMRRDGRIYGRGSADMKSGLAVGLGLLEALVPDAAARSDVLLCATVDEEGPEMLGAHELVRSGTLRPDDQVLALEPTGLRLRIAQIGVRWLELTVRGRMAHAGRAHLGVDANHVAARILDALKERVDGLGVDHPLLGPPRFTCGTIAGGVATNVVPGTCTMRFDLRVVPPLEPADAEDLCRQVAGSVVSEFPGASCDVEPIGPARPAIFASDDSLLVRRLRKCYEAVTGEALESGGADGHEAYTDASMVAALTGSTSCTVFGPGSSDQAHTADEFVDISEIGVVARTLEEVVSRW
jgi:succinyl-diaminopimelate desuccinylase